MEITLTIKRYGVKYATITFDDVAQAIQYLATEGWEVATRDAHNVSMSR